MSSRTSTDAAEAIAGRLKAAEGVFGEIGELMESVVPTAAGASDLRLFLDGLSSRQLALTAACENLRSVVEDYLALLAEYDETLGEEFARDPDIRVLVHPHGVARAIIRDGHATLLKGSVIAPLSPPVLDLGPDETRALRKEMVRECGILHTAGGYYLSMDRPFISARTAARMVTGEDLDEDAWQRPGMTGVGESVEQEDSREEVPDPVPGSGSDETYYDAWDEPKIPPGPSRANSITFRIEALRAYLGMSMPGLSRARSYTRWEAPGHRLVVTYSKAETTATSSRYTIRSEALDWALEAAHAEVLFILPDRSACRARIADLLSFIDRHRTDSRSPYASPRPPLTSVKIEVRGEAGGARHPVVVVGRARKEMPLEHEEGPDDGT